MNEETNRGLPPLRDDEIRTDTVTSAGVAPTSREHRASEPRGEEPGREGSDREILARYGPISRFGLCLLFALTTFGLEGLLRPYPLTARLELWSILGLVGGAVFGPAGILGLAVGNFCITLLRLSKLSMVLINTGAYVMMGSLAYAVFRLVPRVNRGLVDLRSYFAFLSSVVFGSLIIAGTCSANLFLRTMGVNTFWTGFVYWFSSAVTTLLIIAPVLLMVAVWKFRAWLVQPPFDPDTTAALALPAGALGADGRSRSHAEPVVGITIVILTTLVVSPLAHLRPQFGGWVFLLYLVPILWGSISRGLRGGVFMASASGIAYLVGSSAASVLMPRQVLHSEILGQFTGLVILSLVGAVTGAFQQARLRAEADLLRANVELERQHESLALVNRLTDRLKRTLDVEDIAREAVEAINHFTRPPMVAVLLIDEHGGELELMAHHGFDESIVASGRTLPIEGSLSGIAIESRQILVSPNILLDDRLESAVRARLVEAGFRSAVSIPLVFENRSLGAINLLSRDHHTSLTEDLEIYSTIGRTVALAVENARHVARLEHQAFHDLLTGLPNREALHRWFTEHSVVAQMEGRHTGLVLIDIDRFNEVNDALGHHIGDRLLTGIGPRALRTLNDRQPMVFRLAGDEFAIVLPGLEYASDVEGLGRRLLSGLAEPFDIDGITLGVEASAGTSVFPRDGRNSSEVLRCADIALNHAKRTTRGVVQYDELLDKNTPERLALATTMGPAIKNGELVLHFQPKVSLADGRPVGFEALIRWNHPKHGLLLPDQFIPLAEVSDVIHPLTTWVVENALSQLKTWQETDAGLTMAVNLSTRNLLDHSFARKLESIILQSGVDPATVEFELTETALLIDQETTTETLRKISDSGAKVVIDDFGTGYSSMAFLKRCPINSLKIDRSFVKDVLTDAQSRAIVRATVQLADDLDLDLVAEGVENSETVSALTEMGCDIGQGFFFQRPAPAGDVSRRLTEEKSFLA